VQKILMGLVASALIVLAGAASAQQLGRIRGQIEKIDGAAMSLKARDGTMMDVKLAADARVSALTKASLADLKNDTFIGVAGTARPDGSIEAYSIHIFLPAQRGVVPDRFGPWDGKPNATMTNGYVEGSRWRRAAKTSSRPAPRSSSWRPRSSRTAPCWPRCFILDAG
jgi:hypothetical protein